MVLQEAIPRRNSRRGRPETTAQAGWLAAHQESSTQRSRKGTSTRGSQPRTGHRQTAPSAGLSLRSMSADLSVQLGTATTAEILFEPICTLYDQAFSQPPFRWTDEESQHHRELLASLMNEPTFGIVTAETSQHLVGFAYGYQLRPDTQWWQN